MNRICRWVFYFSTIYGLVIWAPDLTAATNGQSAPLVQAAKKISPAVVTIIGENNTVGTGVIIDGQKGYIITNEHVVSGRFQKNVRLANGQEFKPTIIKSDPNLDLALLQIITPYSLPEAFFIDDDNLKPNDHIFTVGAPNDLESTVTTGIIVKTKVNTPHHTLKIDMKNMIQHTAPINPGNSGGPLVNLKGEVIGLNTMDGSMTDSYKMKKSDEVWSFAVPTETIREFGHLYLDSGLYLDPRSPVTLPSPDDYATETPAPAEAPQPITEEPASFKAALAPEPAHPYLGLHLAPLPEEQRTSVQLKYWGCLVESVDADSPAAQAGLMPNDIILSINEVPIKNIKEYEAILNACLIGGVTWVEIMRNDQLKDIQITVGSDAGQ